MSRDAGTVSKSIKDDRLPSSIAPMGSTASAASNRRHHQYHIHLSVQTILTLQGFMYIRTDYPPVTFVGCTT